MRHIMKRLMTLFLTVALLAQMIPTDILGMNRYVHAAEHGYLELNDGYLNVKVSRKNGGFLVDTVEGDKLNKSDNNKYLLYPDENYDTSFTSFRVTQEGVTRDYIFGRDYSAQGIETSDAVVTKTADNAISAVWTVGGLEFTQSLMLLETNSYQHGMVYIVYSMENKSGTPVDDVQARVMLDTALGYQDYAVYMAGHADGSYTSIETEQTLTGEEYSNYFFAYDNEMSPSITAYTMNASVGGVTVVPEKVTFAHWNNLAASVFDYEPGDNPDETLNFTNPYNKEYMTADSAVAMYYSMGSAEAGTQVSSPIGLYYGVYSNAIAEEGSVSINFAGPTAMELSENHTSYVDLNGDGHGNMTLTVKVQNTSDKELEYLAVAFYPEENIVTYNSSGQENLNATAADPYYVFITDLLPGEARDVTLNLAVSPSETTDYRKINVRVFDVAEQMESGGQLHLMEEDIIMNRESYVLCPGIDGGVLSFISTAPEIIYYTGTRSLFIAGRNFNLLRDTSQYRVLLRPLNGGPDVEVPAENVIINTEDNTANLILDQTMANGTWQVIFDWTDAGMTDTTSEALRFVVSNNSVYSGGTYGVLAIQRTGDGSDAAPYHYELLICQDEAEYKSKTSGVSIKDILLEFRGNFSMTADEKGRIGKLEAVAVKSGDAINISNCIEVTDGRLTVSLEYDENGKQAAINTDIDGQVYTVGANTKVWDGVCAITSLEEGEQYQLPVYKYDGTESTNVEDAVANTEFIALMWPGAASTAQTLAGILLEMRYCHFGLMASEPGAGANGTITPDTRVVSFAAQMDPSFLVPSSFDWGEIQTPAIDAVQLKLASSNYTAEQLRDVEEKYAADREKWEEAQAGTLALYVHDILFGGGFIGFNTTLEVGVPSYSAGMPGIEGTLNLKVINEEWAIGVEGAADMAVFSMEAELALRSYNGIPVPDTVRFFVGGTYPGVPVDTCGIFWIRGVGAGVDKIYETYFVSTSIPPLTLMLSGEFAIFTILSARADVSLSGRGISGSLSNVGIGELELLEQVKASVYWHPRWNVAAGVRMNILDTINGTGSVVVQEVPTGVADETKIFWEGYAKAAVKLPDALGGFEIGNAQLGLDPEKIWGALHVIKVDAGVTYYWGGDVDFAFGKYDAPEPTLEVMTMSIPVYTDSDTGRTLYMTAMTNARLLSSTLALDETEISSSADKCTHTFYMSSAANEDGVLIITYPAENAIAAQDSRKVLSITCDGEAYTLQWLDDSKPADDPANLNANAMFRYDENSGYVTVTVSFTEAEQFDTTVQVVTANASDLTLYGLERMANLTAVTLSEDQKTAITVGEQLEKLSDITVYASNEDGEVYLLGTAVGSDSKDGSLQIALSYPSDMPSGDYTVQVVGKQLDEAGQGVANPIVETQLAYVNPAQPAALSQVAVELGGDYTLDVTVDSVDGIDGYMVSIYEYGEDGTLTETIFADQQLTENTFTVGGSYDMPQMDETGELTDTVTVGLVAGKQYVVGVRAYVTTTDNLLLCSEETLSEAETMVKPVKNTVTLTLEGGEKLSGGYADTQIDTAASGNVSISVAGISNGSGAYTLNGGDAMTWNGGNITFNNLPDGIYTLQFNGENKTKDSFGTVYQFAVDTKTPALMIASPVSGSFFSEDTVTITGISDPGAVITASVEGGQSVKAAATADGSFTVEVPLDSSKAYQYLTVIATDAVGNQSDSMNIVLTNQALGNPAAEAVLICNGEVVTEVICSSEARQLTMALQVGEQLIALDTDSVMGSSVEYQVDVRQGSAQITWDGLLSGSADAVGMVTATLGTYCAAAQFVSGDLKDATVTLDLPEGGYIYDESLKTPAVVSVIIQGVTLTENVDYTVSYSDNMAAGEGKVTITAIEGSGYVGTITVSFPIAKASISTVSPEVTEPAKGQEPQTRLNIPAGCEAAEISWTLNGEKVTGTFAAGNTYTATVVLTPDSNHVFAETVTADGWNCTVDNNGVLTMTRSYSIEADDKPENDKPENDKPEETKPAGTTPAKVTYLISFIADGKLVATRTVAHGDTLTDIPVIPAKLGYTDVAPVWDVTDFTKITSNMTVNAIYTADVYKVIFQADGKTVETINMRYGQSLAGSAFPAVPKKEGYSGVWDRSSIDRIYSNLIIRAEYTANAYTLILPANTQGYSLTADSAIITTGQELKLTVDIWNGYSATEEFAILISGKEVPQDYITGDDSSLYVNIPAEDLADYLGEKSQLTIDTRGVADIIAPTILRVDVERVSDTEAVVSVQAEDAGTGIELLTLENQSLGRLEGTNGRFLLNGLKAGDTLPLLVLVRDGAGNITVQELVLSMSEESISASSSSRVEMVKAKEDLQLQEAMEQIGTLQGVPLYYTIRALESTDGGKTWKTAKGTVILPFMEEISVETFDFIGAAYKDGKATGFRLNEVEHGLEMTYIEDGLFAIGWGDALEESSAEPEISSDGMNWLWWLLLPLVIAIAVLVILILKKKKKEE